MYTSNAANYYIHDALCAWNDVFISSRYSPTNKIFFLGLLMMVVMLITCLKWTKYWWCIYRFKYTRLNHFSAIYVLWYIICTLTEITKDIWFHIMCMYFVTPDNYYSRYVCKIFSTKKLLDLCCSCCAHVNYRVS